jgi:hypothetical protein
VAGTIGALLLACSSAAPVPDFQTQDPQVHGGKTNPNPPAMTDAADGGSSGASSSGSGGACTTVAPNNKCGLDPQCACGNNETCDVTNTATGATSCVTAGGGTLGRNCKSTGDCLAGYTCQYGACRPYCTSSTDGATCSATGTGICYSVMDDANKAIPNARVCTIDCDPRMPSAVCGTNTCIWFADLYAPAHVSDCNYPGSTDVLYGCALDSNDPKGGPLLTACKPGNGCGLHPTYGYECERWCRVGNDSDCAGLQAKPTDPAFHCKDVYGASAPVIGGVKEGLCQDG